MRAYERTTSRRFRSGTRRNKKYPTCHIPVCGQVTRQCLVHTPNIDITLGIRVGLATFGSGPAAPMAMKLTACEQRWVDDVRSGRKHRHGLLGITKKRGLAIINVRRLIKEMHFAQLYGNGTKSSPSKVNPRTGRITTAPIPVQSINPAHRQRHQVGEPWNDPAQARLDELRAQRQRLDISDRWYPRG